MSKGLVKDFGLTARGLLTAISTIAPIAAFSKASTEQKADTEANKPQATLVNNPVDHYTTGMEEIPSGSRRDAGALSKGQIVIHFNESERFRAVVMHNVLEEMGKPTSIISGREDAEEPFEVIVNYRPCGKYNIEDADRFLVGDAIASFDHVMGIKKMTASTNSDTVPSPGT